MVLITLRFFQAMSFSFGLWMKWIGISIHSSMPSVAITIQGALWPEGWAICRSSMALMVPEVGACWGTLTKPAASAITCPFSTRCPGSTTGAASNMNAGPETGAAG